MTRPTRCRSSACSTTSSAKPTTRVSSCSWSKNTTRRVADVQSVCEGFETRRNTSSRVSRVWAGRDDNADKNGALNTGKRAFGQVPETAVRGGGWTGTARHADHRPTWRGTCEPLCIRIRIFNPQRGNRTALTVGGCQLLNHSHNIIDTE